MNMIASNPVLHSPRTDINGNDLPNKVRAFKAVQVSILPSISQSPTRMLGSGVRTPMVRNKNFTSRVTNRV
jgi:hypothetical protein